MPITEMVLNFLRVLLDWPAVALIVAILVSRWLRTPLAGLLNRVGVVEGYGIRVATTPDPSQQQHEAREGLQPKTEHAALEYIRTHPEEIAKHQVRLYNSYWFERAFNLIYGSQLDLLEHLQSKGDVGEKYVNLLPFFQAFLKRGGTPNTQLADYLEFLRSMKFIEYYDRDGEQHARITPYGVDFLSYLRAEYPAGYRFKPW